MFGVEMQLVKPMARLIFATLLCLPALSFAAYDAWVDEQFDGAYERLNACIDRDGDGMPMNVRWESEAGEDRWAKFKRKGDAGIEITTKAPVGTGGNGSGVSHEEVVLVDDDGDGTINAIGLAGSQLSRGPAIERDEGVALMFHTAVAAASKAHPCMQ